MATLSDVLSLDIDPLTMSAIVRLHLEDVQELASGNKGKQREGTVTDAQAAMQKYKQDLQDCSTVLEDRKMAQSIALAVQHDGDLLHTLFEQERQIALDREMALRLARGMRTANQTKDSKPDISGKSKKSDLPDPWEDTEFLSKANAIYMDYPTELSLPPLPALTPDAESGDGTAESSAWAASRRGNEKPKKGNCIACGDEKDFFDVARVPCNHEYCRPCLEDIFSLSMKDETLFPPRCDGQEIPLHLVRFFLPSELAKKFEAKYDELSTKNRTYCHDHACESWIPPNSIRDEIATCTKCRKTTCTICKLSSHTGDCPEDEALQQLLQTSEAQQWQRCPTCKAIVELGTGCNHITCRCGAQFCYVCSARWRTCSCPQWNEQRLYARAAQAVALDRDANHRLFHPPRVEHGQPENRNPSQTGSASSNAPGPGPAGPIREEDRVAEMAEHLRENHNCDHDSWEKRDGEHRCEECRNLLREYIFVCRQCRLAACHRCRRNRL